MKRTIWTVAMLTLPTMALAASFDCTKGSTKVEKLICSSKELSSLDDGLEDAYKNLLKRIFPESRKEYLIEEQRRWIKGIRNGCQDEKCLSEAYDIRIKFLSRVQAGVEEINSSDTFELETDPKDIESIRRDFQSALADRGITTRLQTCPIVLSSQFGRGNVVYGVICTNPKSSQYERLLMCKDSMVGYLTISITSGLALEEVKAFAKVNCLKGG